MSHRLPASRARAGRVEQSLYIRYMLFDSRCQDAISVTMTTLMFPTCTRAAMDDASTPCRLIRMKRRTRDSRAAASASDTTAKEFNSQTNIMDMHKHRLWQNLKQQQAMEGILSSSETEQVRPDGNGLAGVYAFPATANEQDPVVECGECEMPEDSDTEWVPPEGVSVGPEHQRSDGGIYYEPPLAEHLLVERLDCIAIAIPIYFGTRYGSGFQKQTSLKGMGYIMKNDVLCMASFEPAR